MQKKIAHCTSRFVIAKDNVVAAAIDVTTGRWHADFRTKMAHLLKRLGNRDDHSSPGVDYDADRDFGVTPWKQKTPLKKLAERSSVAIAYANGRAYDFLAGVYAKARHVGLGGGNAPHQPVQTG